MVSFSGVLTWAFIGGILIGGVLIGYLLYPRFFPSAATVTPSVTGVDLGQSVSIGVGWKGGSAPYTVSLYSSSTSDCSSSSTQAGSKSGLSSPQFIFTVAPTVPMYYCGTVTSSGGSSGTSPTVRITVSPALSVPTLSLSPSGMNFGQTGTVTATVTAAGGAPPYVVTLYSGTSSTCSADTKVVSVTSGSNPLTGLAGTTGVFSFAAPATGTYYCANVMNGLSASISSATVKFDINPVFALSISPSSPKLDAGQLITLIASASQGTPPYTYQWYTGGTCTAAISGQTSSTYSPGTQSSTGIYSVQATDSSTGTPRGMPCAKATVTVASYFTGTPTSISPSTAVIDAGQSANLTVTCTGAGTAPYTVKLTSSASPSCSGAVSTGLNMTGLFSTSAHFQTTPRTTVYYCAEVTDSATSPQSATTPSSSGITVNTALSPRVVLAPSAIDTGQSVNLRAIVDLSTGTPPYSVTLYYGDSPVCLLDKTVAEVTSGFNPVEGAAGPSATFDIPTPGVQKFYCASVTDGSDAPASASSPFAIFSVNMPLSATISPGTPKVDSGQSLTLAAVASHGTLPYGYQWYDGTDCSNAISGRTSSTYSTGVLNATKSYSVKVMDGSLGTPHALVCVNTTVTVSPALVPTLLLSPSAMDAGQAVTVTATVSWTGGATSFTVSLFSGTSSNCALDVIKVTLLSGLNPRAGLGGSPATFSFTAPGTSTYYCASVKDSAATPVTVFTSASLFTVNPALGTVFFSVSPNVLDSGQSPITITAFVSWSGGTSPYTVTLHSGSSTSCAADTIVAAVTTGSNPNPGVSTTSTTFAFLSPASNTYYCVTVKDSSLPTAVLSTPSLFTVNPALSLAAPALAPSSLDTGQSATIAVAASWLGGSAPYTITLRSGSNPSTCSLDTTTVAVILSSNPQTGLTLGSASFTFASPGLTTYYCISVKDSSAVPVTKLSPVSKLTFNPTLVVSPAVLSPAAIDLGQTTIITATVTWSGGTPLYTASLFSGLSSSCSLDNTAVGAAQTGLAGPSTTFTFASPGSTTYYCARVTDSSGVPNTAIPSASIFTVHPDPKVTVSPPAPVIASGASLVFTATPTLGIPPYTYQWYTGGSCTSSIGGQTSSTYSTGTLTVTSTFSVKITDSSIGTPSSLSTACASVTVSVGSGPEGVAANPTTGMVYVADPASGNVSVIDSSTNTVVARIHLGAGSTLPWGVAVNSGTNLVYVSGYGTNTVYVIAGVNNTLVHTIGVGTHPTGLAVNPSTSKLYVANSGSKTVSVINTLTNAVSTTVTVGNVPQGVAIGPGPLYTVYVTNYGSNTISIIDSSYLVTTATVGSNPWGVAVNLATNRVFVTNSGSGTVSVINGSTYALVATIAVGGTPEGIAVDSGTSKAYVANSATNSIAEINTATNSLILSGSPLIPIPVGTRPWGVALIPGSNLAYVTNSGSNTVSVISLLTDGVTTTIIVA